RLPQPKRTPVSPQQGDGSGRVGCQPKIRRDGQTAFRAPSQFRRILRAYSRASLHHDVIGCHSSQLPALLGEAVHRGVHVEGSFVATIRALEFAQRWSDKLNVSTWADEVCVLLPGPADGDEFEALVRSVVLGRQAESRNEQCDKASG